MILDKETLFSNAQAITADAASTNIFDTGSVSDVGRGNILRLFGHVIAAFDALTSLNIILETDDNASFSSAKTLWTVNRVLAQLTAGADLELPAIPRGCERYLRLRYDVVGSNPTVGSISAGVVLDEQAWAATEAAAPFNN